MGLFGKKRAAGSGVAVGEGAFAGAALFGAADSPILLMARCRTWVRPCARRTVPAGLAAGDVHVAGRRRALPDGAVGQRQDHAVPGAVGPRTRRLRRDSRHFPWSHQHDVPRRPLVRNLDAGGERGAGAASRNDGPTSCVLAEILPTDCLGQPAMELSGGMRRRVSLARAVAFPSDLIVLDEPFTVLTRLQRKRSSRSCCAIAPGARCWSPHTARMMRACWVLSA